MKINRHNYEEYFILYMDNELNSKDRRMVEELISLHPDLKEELNLLLQYKLSPDAEILFPGKEELLKVNGETPVTLNNYEEWLVLYTDNELNAVQRTEVEKFIEVNPELEKQLALLQITKLQPEQIVFTDKESLYRTEENVRSLPSRWWRVAAAVLILIGLGTATAVIINNRTSDKNEIVKGTGAEKKSIPEIPVITPVQKENIPANETPVADNRQLVSETVVRQSNKNKVDKNDKTLVKEKFKDNKTPPAKKDEPVIADVKNKPSNNLPQPVNNPNINFSNATNDAFASIKPPKEIITPQKPLTTSEVTNVIPASYTNNNEAEQLEEGGSNKKNRGFFRKLVRTFEKRTDMTATDDDRLLVGGLSIKLK